MALFNIKFSVNCETNFGEVLYISGNAPELGNWNTQNAMRLYTDATLYPKWNAFRTIQVRQANKLLFKLCIINQQKTIRWENILGNRQVVASENLLVDFTAHFQQMTITPLTEQIVRPPRKKTCDILNELQSDGSSSKQFWKHYMNEEQQSILYITLTAHMRRIVEYQNDTSLFTDNLDLHRSSSQFDKNLLNKIQKTCQVTHKTSNFYCIMQTTENDELISVLGQDSYLIKFSQFSNYSIHNNQVPIFFHVQSLKKDNQNKACLEVFQNICRIVHAQNILLSQKQKKLQYFMSVKLNWDPTKELIDKFIQKKVAVLLIDSQRILQIVLQLITSMNLEYCTQDFTQITIFLKNLGTMKLKLIVESDRSYKLSNQSSKKQRNQHENKYFDSIKKSVLQNSNKSYAGYSKSNFIESIKQDETFVGLIYHRKNVLIINADKIEDLSSKLLMEIIALSSKPNFQVFIILDKINQDIKNKFPVSKNNKIVVIGKNGSIYANQQIFIDIIQTINLQKSKFTESINKIQSSITLGLDSKQSSNNQLIFEFKKNHVGKIGFDILKTKIKQHNEESLHKLVIQQRQGGKLCVKPFCLTEQFFLKSILQNLSKHVHEDRSLVLTVNMKNDNRFVQKANTIFRRIFKNKNSVKMRNTQIISNTETEYTGISKQQVINQKTLEAELEFMGQHFLTGSHIKSYNLNILSPMKGRRSFVQKLNVHQYSSQNF